MTASTRPRPAVVEWIALFAGIVLLLRQAWLLDDAFVYFRYADNLLFLGRGLVFNQGEWVEGYSSPLWMLLLVALRSLQLDWWLLVRLLGVGIWIVAWLGIVRVRWLSAPHTARVWNLPLLYLTLSYPVLCYWTSGLETPLVQLGAVVSMLLLLEPRRRSWQIAVSFLPLVRHELALPWLVLFLCVAWSLRRVPRWMLGTTAGVMAVWLLVRVLLYADFLPNTFYLKHGSEWAQGWLYLRQFAGAQGLWWLLAAGAVALIWEARQRLVSPQRPARIGAFAAATIAAMYAVRVGGDMMYYRFLAYSFPLLLLAFSGLLPRIVSATPAPIRRMAMPTLAALTACTSLLPVPPQLDRNPHLGLANVESKRPVVVDQINDANSHRRHEDFGFSPWTLQPVLEQRELYAGFLEGGGSAADHPRVEMQGWCYDSYRDFEARVVHRWGLTDPMLARLQLPWDKPGHRRGLIVHAEELLTLRREVRVGKRPAGIRTQLRGGHLVPTWARENVDAMDVLEARMANTHSLLENLQLAFQFVPGYPPRR